MPPLDVRYYYILELLFSVVEDLKLITHPWQRVVPHTFESPKHENISGFFNGRTNWTFTCHHKSDIMLVAGFYVPKGEYHKGPYYIPPVSTRNRGTYIQQLVKKSDTLTIDTIISRQCKLVLWIVSNCKVSDRISYADELVKNGIKLDRFF